MQPPHKALAGPKPQEEPARGKPFAGRPALISSLAEGAQEYQREPPRITSVEQIESRQILQARLIYETVLDVVSARTNIANFSKELILQATAIATKRQAAARVSAESETPLRPAPETSGGKPENRQEALERALAESGFDAKVSIVKEAGSITIFMIECGGESCKFPVSDAVMQSENPVAEIKVRLSAVSIGISSEELVAKNRQKNLAILRSTRPPPTPLDIQSKELDGRKIHFDGEMAGQWYFTYVYPGTETTFILPGDVTGKDLLEKIDEKVDAFQNAIGKPYPAEVLETRAKERSAKLQLQGVPEDLRAIACALDYLASCPLEMRNLVPAEYLEGFDALKKLPAPYPAFISDSDKIELDGALDEIDHPIGSIVRETFGSGSSMLDASAQAEVGSLLHLVPSVSAGICDAAIRNIAEAYCLITIDNGAVFSSPEEHRRSYFKMMFMLRREIERAISEGVLEVGL